MMLKDQNAEKIRLSALSRLSVLDTPPEAEFDGLVKVAASVCRAPISLITLVDHDRQWFKANVGLEDVLETPREVAFCSHAIQNEGIFEVSDASLDPRFVDNPLVTGDPNIRFYAGSTLRLSNGAHVGTLCIIDRKPRKLTIQQRTILQHLSAAVVQALESRRVTRDLATSEAQFRALSAAAPLGVFRTNSKGEFTYTNERWQSIFGLSAPESMRNGWIATLHHEDKDAVIAQWTTAVRARREFDMEFRLLHSDGSVKYVRSIFCPITTEDGEVCGNVGSVEDVSERVRSRQIRFKKRRRLQSIIEGTGAGTWEWNIQTGETRFNDRWGEMLGISLEALKSTSIQTWKKYVHPQDADATRVMLDKHIRGNCDFYDNELRMLHSEGHWIWVHIRGRVLTHTAAGLPEWMYGTQLDITQRKEQENALRKNEWLLAETGALANVGGWEVDLASRTVQWTKQTCRIHGVPDDFQPELEEAIEFYAPEARPVIQDVIDRAMKEGREWDIELPLVQRTGDAIWVRSVGHVEYELGMPKRLIGAFQNITDRVIQRQALEIAHERVSVATESGNIGVWDWDLGSGKLAWTTQMYSLYGMSDDSKNIDRSQWAKLIHPEDRAFAVQTLHQATEAENGAFDMEFRVVWPDGSLHYIRSSANITRNALGTASRMVGVNWDVTPLRRLSNRLAEQHELLHVTLQSIGDAVITTDASGNVTWLNPASEYMTGWSSEDAIGNPLSNVFNIIHEDSRCPTVSPVRTCLDQGTGVGLASKTVLVSRNGTEFGIEDSAAPIRSKNGELLGVVLVFHDVTEQRRLTEEMNFRATHDALTGLVNRSEFESQLQVSLSNLSKNECANALMYIDLDQFKLVNDACGHSQGDQLLIQIAKLLGQIVRAGDTLARLGGDEFGIFMKDVTRAQAQLVAQNICDRMNEFRFEYAGRRFRIGTSVGLVPLDKRWTDIELAMQAADTSCLAAKEAGRNRVHVWFDNDRAVRARRKDMHWATRLEQALDEGSFELFAQRIESFSDRKSGVHAETLLRLRDTDGSVIPPNAFLPAAERFNLATRIDRWVLENSLNVLAQLADITSTDMLCVNLSGQSVSDRVFHKEAVQLLEYAGNDVCERICLEITETAAVTNIADASIFIEQVRALGVRIALDDFGAGASSFGYLKSLPVDILKIDGQFITGVIDDPLDAAAVRCFVDISRVMKLKTVAEYVESRPVLDCLEQIGVDYAQGFFIHEPEPIERVLRCSETKLEAEISY